MRTSKPSQPIACALDGDDRDLVFTAWRDLLDSAPEPSRRGAARLAIEVDEAWVIDLFELVDVERRCCSHLDFTVEVRHGSVVLVVEGPGAADWYDALAPGSRAVDR